MAVKTICIDQWVQSQEGGRGRQGGGGRGRRKGREGGRRGNSHPYLQLGFAKLETRTHRNVHPFNCHYQILKSMIMDKSSLVCYEKGKLLEVVL